MRDSSLFERSSRAYGPIPDNDSGPKLSIFDHGLPICSFLSFQLLVRSTSRKGEWSKSRHARRVRDATCQCWSYLPAPPSILLFLPRSKAKCHQHLHLPFLQPSACFFSQPSQLAVESNSRWRTPSVLAVIVYALPSVLLAVPSPRVLTMEYHGILPMLQPQKLQTTRECSPGCPERPIHPSTTSV